jgi:hypothetical protein
MLFESPTSLARITDTEVLAQTTPDGQDILIQRSRLGRNLANLLASDDVKFVQLEDAAYWRIPHDRSVDALLTELIDLFISIRYAHPSLVRLELALTEGQWAEVEP